MARSLNVPVVVSISLSNVVNVPVANLLTLERSKAVTGSLAPALKRRVIRGRLSSGVENMTLIGSSWVMTTRPVASVGCT